MLSGHPAGPHVVVRPIFAPPSFTHLVGAESTRELSLTDGQAANARVLAVRAQNSSAGTAGRLPVQWHGQIQAVRAAVGPLVSPRCTRGAKRCLRRAWRAPRGASEAGTGGPPTRRRPIEADVRPTRPGRGGLVAFLGHSSPATNFSLRHLPRRRTLCPPPVVRGPPACKRRLSCTLTQA